LLIKALNARGFGNKQIAHYLTHHGTKLKTLGEPAQLAAAAKALKGVKAVGVNTAAVKAVGGDPHVANALVTIGHQVGATPKQMLAAVETGIVEQNLKNLPSGGGGSVGWRQEQQGHAGKSVQQRMNLNDSIRRYYAEVKHADSPSLSPGQLAQKVQASAFPRGTTRTRRTRGACCKGPTGSSRRSRSRPSRSSSGHTRRAENPEEPSPLRHPEHADPRGLDVQPDLDLHFRGDVD
jgi:hypothetical protein